MVVETTFAGKVLLGLTTALLIGFSGWMVNNDLAHSSAIHKLETTQAVQIEQNREIIRRLTRIEDAVDTRKEGENSRTSRTEDDVDRLYRYLRVPRSETRR